MKYVCCRQLIIWITKNKMFPRYTEITVVIVEITPLTIWNPEMPKTDRKNPTSLFVYKQNHVDSLLRNVLSVVVDMLLNVQFCVIRF